MENLVPAYPDDKIFAPPKNITSLGTVTPYEFDHADYPTVGAPLVYKKKLLYPHKGFVFPEAIMCVNVAKRLFIDSVYLLKSKNLLGLYLSLFFTSYKGKIELFNELLSVYNRSMILVVKSVAPLQKHLIPVANELWGIIENFLLGIGVEKQNASMFAEIFAVCVNYDNAYHYRLLDLFSETTKEKMIKDPIKEIKKIVQINFEREGDKINTPWKFRYISYALRAAFLSKRIKNAFVEALTQSTWKNLCYDKIDLYNILERGDYKFLGLTYQQRLEIFIYLHKGKHPGQLNIQY